MDPDLLLKVCWRWKPQHVEEQRSFSPGRLIEGEMGIYARPAVVRVERLGDVIHSAQLKPARYLAVSLVFPLAG